MSNARSLLPVLFIGAAIGSNAADPLWRWSTAQTINFGVEADWTNSARVDLRHADVSVYYCGGNGAFFIRADAPPSATNLLLDIGHLYANTNTREVLPSVPPQYTFIGVTNNQRFWNLEQNFFANQLWLGLRSDGDLSRLASWKPDTAASSGKYVRVQLLAVRGPTNGHFSLFQWGSPNPSVYLATSDGISTSDVFHLTAGGHDHFNWSFTQAGLYQMDIRVGTYVNPPTNNPAILLSHSYDGTTNHVIRWNCDPCLRYWVEHSASMQTEATWSAVSGTSSLYAGQSTLISTAGTPSVITGGFFRIQGEP